MELPDYAKEDITADHKDDYLVTNTENNSTDEEKDEKGNCIRCDRHSGSCQKSFYVGKNVTQNDINASFLMAFLNRLFLRRRSRLKFQPTL